jgi:hypothetical protein
MSASVAFHALLVAMVVLLPAPRRPKRPQEERVSVDILTPRQFEAAIRPKAAAEAAALPQALQPAIPAPADATLPSRLQPPATPAMIRPMQMLSARTLADPRSRQARADLATFSSDERMLQLCDLEAMDQIHQWRREFQPDRVVPYALSRERITGTTVAANGAAFRSRKNWYALTFKCELAQDGESVVGFEFLVGDPVPREKWDELGLPALH